MKKTQTISESLLVNDPIWTPVEDFSAVGDGSTDDAAAIQDAIDSYKLVSLTPNKTYLIESPLEIGEKQSLYIPPSSILLYNAEEAGSAAIIMSNHSTLAGEGRIVSTRYDWEENEWNTSDRKSAIKIIGWGVNINIGYLCGFEYGIEMGGAYEIAYCNIDIRYFINVLYCFLINPTDDGYVNQNYFHWNATSINWENTESFRSNSHGIYMDGEGEPNHNTFCGSIENYYIALRLSGAFNRFLGFRTEFCDYSVVINDAGTQLGTRFNTIFGEYGNSNSFYSRILNGQQSPFRTIQYAVQIYGPEGINLLKDVYADYYYSNSDISLKEDIKPLVGGLKKVLALRGTRYKLKSSKNKSETEYQYGFIAQEVLETLPELVKKADADSKYSINYLGLIPILVEAIKELETKLRGMDKKVSTLKNAIIKANIIVKDQNASRK